MRISKRLLTVVAAATVGLVVSTGCALYATGVGMIQSVNRVDKAVFGFSFDGPKGKLSGRYYDHGTGHHLKFDGIESYVNEPGNHDQCMVANGRYESKTKGKPGAGTVRIVACDGPVATFKKDMISVAVLTGPLAGYANDGELIAGDIRTYTRPQPVPEYDDRDHDRGRNHDHDNDNDNDPDRDRGD